MRTAKHQPSELYKNMLTVVIAMLKNPIALNFGITELE